MPPSVSLVPVLFTAQVRTLQLVVNVAVGGVLPAGSGWVDAVTGGAVGVTATGGAQGTGRQCTAGHGGDDRGRRVIAGRLGDGHVAANRTRLTPHVGDGQDDRVRARHR